MEGGGRGGGGLVGVVREGGGVMGRGGVKLASYTGGPNPSSIPKWALVGSNWGPTGAQLGPI